MASNPLFNTIELLKPRKNVFDLSHDVKLSCNMGELIPTLAMECVPGDNITIGCQSLLRFAPLLAPVMHRFDVSMHYFFVPNRLIWNKWEDYITNTPIFPGGPLPGFPTLHNITPTRLHDYMGIPAYPGSNPIDYSALPYAAYQMIYNEYYRDQNLIPEVNFNLTNGDNSANTALTVLRKRAWEKDYFTSALPFAQKGAAVDIPMSFQDVAVKWNPPTGSDTIQLTGQAPPSSGFPADLLLDAGTPDPAGAAPDNYAYAETSGLTGSALITDLRRATKLQEWLERAARAGSRYTENLLSFFGVRAQDSRLQRPEYITGTKSPVIVSEVLSTTSTAGEPLGDMGGHAVSAQGGKYGRYYCQEHGYIIGIMSILPKACYQQGIAKHFLKTHDPFEFFWPQFANIGEQPITNAELYAFTATNNGTFGYTPRYAEYKHMSPRVCGDFRSSLNYWHDGRIFASQPALNQAFVECVPDLRIFAVTNPAVDHMYMQILHEIRAVRPMPKYGTPSF